VWVCQRECTLGAPAAATSDMQTILKMRCKFFVAKLPDAAHKRRLSLSLSPPFPLASRQLQCACMCTVAGICALWLAAAEGFSLAKPSRSEMGVALYLGLVPTALCSLLQTIGQRNIPAEAASIIYALDPVYTAILGAFFLGETLGTKGMLGGGLVFVSSLLNFEASRAPHEHVS
jgi:drug/metabolite transporter (DMT)-like permease